VASEPLTPPPASATPERVVRTFAQDVARLSGKPMEPVAPKTATVPPVQASTPPVTDPPKVVAPLPEPPPAYVIPKAPTTSESRESVLERLKRNAVQEAQAEAIALPKAPSTGESREAVLARLKTSATALEPAAVPIPVPKPTAPERIHTYKSDFADHIDTKDASAFSVLAAQSDATGERTVVLKEKKRFPIALVAGILLVLLGGGSVFAAFFAVTHRVIPLFAPHVPSLVAADAKRELSGEPGALLSELAQIRNEPLAEGAVMVVYTAIASTSSDGAVFGLPQEGGELVKALALPMPDILFRSIQQESTVGIIRAGGEQHAFFILRVDSFERAFAGMLEWEPRIVSDLALLYPAYPLPESSATTTASSTPEALPDLVFTDEITGNRDVRVLRDITGRALLTYGFRDKETLIIARDETAFLELVRRLAASAGN